MSEPSSPSPEQASGESTTAGPSAAKLRVSVFENRQLVYTTDLNSSLEIGRQDRGEPPPYRVEIINGRRRLMMAPMEETAVSRKHLLLEPLGGDAVRG